MREQQTPEEAELLPGGDYIAPDVTPEVREFINACRRLIYSEEFTPIIQQALTGAGSLAEGIAPVLVEIITRAEDKMGPLSDEDFASVALHLAGTLVGFAKIMDAPDAQNPEEAVQDTVALMVEMTEGEPEGEEMPPEEAPDEQMGGALAQLR